MRRATITQLAHAVKLVGTVVGAGSATYCLGGRVSVPLPADWSLSLSTDDAGRLRLEACLGGRVRRTMWCLVGDDLRLAELALSVLGETAALTA